MTALIDAAKLRALSKKLKEAMDASDEFTKRTHPEYTSKALSRASIFLGRELCRDIIETLESVDAATTAAAEEDKELIEEGFELAMDVVRSMKIDQLAGLAYQGADVPKKWMRDTTIWNEHIEAVAARMILRMRNTIDFAEPRGKKEAP